MRTCSKEYCYEVNCSILSQLVKKYEFLIFRKIYLIVWSKVFKNINEQTNKYHKNSLINKKLNVLLIKFIFRCKYSDHVFLGFAMSNAKLFINLNLFTKSYDNQASWSSGNAFVIGAGCLKFKSRAAQSGHSVASGSPPLQHFFERSCVFRVQ